MREWLGRFAILGFGLLVAPPYAAAGPSPASAGGHLSVGYSHLFIADSPGGSISVTAGVDYPLAPRWRLGADLGFALLGSRTIELDSLQIGNLDYSMFETALLLHWRPEWGPLARVSFGPAMMSLRAEVSTAGGGIPFTRFAVEEVAPGFAVDATLLKWSSHSPVLGGIELGVHTAFLDDETWTIGSARVTIHY